MTTTVTQSLRSHTATPLIVDLLGSEWIKIRTLRSTYWTLLAVIVGMNGFGTILVVAYVHHLSDPRHTPFSPASYSESGFFLAQLAVGILGAMSITVEYSTGSIRTTLASAPQRIAVLTAKAIVVTSLIFTVGAATSLGALFVGQRVFAGKGIPMSLIASTSLRSVLGVALYFVLLGLFALAVGGLVRSTVGAVSLLVAILIFCPVIVGGLPATWQDQLNPYLPSVAGQVIIGQTKFLPTSHLPSPWVGTVLFAAYAFTALMACAISLCYRDA